MNIAKRLQIITGKDGSKRIKGSMIIAQSIIIVTGASSGIGAATARELAQRGATVVLAARRADALNKMVSDLTQAGYRALAVPTDVTSRESIDYLVAQTVETYGRVDGVINVAGIGGAGIIERASDEVLEQMVMINLKMKGKLPGPEIVAQAVIRVLERPRRALVVPSSWRLMLLGVRFFPAIADRLLGSPQGQTRIHTS